VLGDRALFAAKLGAFCTEENVGFGGSNVIGEHELALDFVLATFDGGEEIFVRLCNAHHFGGDFVRNHLGFFYRAFGLEASMAL
jgi:hypothetical protein